MFSKIMIGLLVAFAAGVIWASIAGWGLAKPARSGPSVRHGSTHHPGTHRRRPYYYHFGRSRYGRTHGRYGGK
jgi:hypothetical protein